MDDRYYMMGRYRKDVEDVEKNDKEKERGAVNRREDEIVQRKNETMKDIGRQVGRQTKLTSESGIGGIGTANKRPSDLKRTITIQQKYVVLGIL